VALRGKRKAVSIQRPQTRIPRTPIADDAERELYRLFDAVEAKLKALPPVRWQSLTVTRAGAGFEVRVTI
jgi:hypothetical protein